MTAPLDPADPADPAAAPRGGPATDDAWMAEAIAMAAGARRSVSPRPWVGAVVVTDDGRSFRGATTGRTGPHAEVVALEAAGAAARGATLYCTLEPCSHHGTTPPCADAVVAAGIRRAVVALEDPDPLVAGQGLARLLDAGIEVTLGVGGDAVTEQLAPYLTHRRTGRPLVVLKLAATLDGRTAAPDGTSQWITGPVAREDAHRLRADSDAVLVGAGTVRTDDPALTVRLPAGEADGVEPLRVVLGRAPEGAKVHPCLELSGDLGGVLDELGRRGVLQVLVEGGAGVAHAVHRAGLVDRYVVYLAPALFGGDDARGLFAGPGAATIADVWRGRIAEVRHLGDDLRVDLLPGAAPGGPEPTSAGPAGPGAGTTESE
ncbi:MAG: bifunctional diaminohydroxyphosphoribosylaminopyrimidine deaminase/5-amino-6-(5-phosphoribosylamino)uracil reductase RibD [Acidimicrobiales bacterium]